MHMAAKSPPANQHELISSNIDYLGRIISLAEELGIQRAVFFSAVSVYGAQEKFSVCETDPLVQPDFYGATKYIGEKMFELSMIKTICFRLPAILGRRNKTNVVARFYEKLKNEEGLTLFNADKPFNNYIDVKTIFEFALKVDIVKDFDMINIAAKQDSTLLDIAALIRRMLSSSSTIERSNEAKPFFNLSTQKAEELYGFVPPDGVYILEEWIKDKQNQ